MMSDLEKQPGHETGRNSPRTALVRTVSGLIAILALVLVVTWGIRRLLPELLPAANGPAAVTSATPTATPTPNPDSAATLAPYPEEIVYYTVQPGDTLSTISEKTGLPAAVIAERNGLPGDCYAYPASDQGDCALEPGAQLILGFRDTLPPTPTPTEENSASGPPPF